MTPIERAARALAKAVLDSENDNWWNPSYNQAYNKSLNQFVDECWPEWEEPARAVLLAIREPSEAMVLANSDAGGPDDLHTILDWQAMIDAALEEKP